MILTLTNGYPYPYPENLTQQEQDALSEAAPGTMLDLPGVKHFEIKHTVTVEFENYAAFEYARLATGWPLWDAYLTLEAKHSVEDGYDIITSLVVKDIAYCGFYLRSEK